VKHYLDSSDGDYPDRLRRLRGLPVYEILARFEKSLLTLEAEGGKALSDPAKVDAQALAEFFVNPLSDRSWRLDTRTRRTKGMSRLGRAVREQIAASVDSGQVGTFPRPGPAVLQAAAPMVVQAFEQATREAGWRRSADEKLLALRSGLLEDPRAGARR